VDGTAWPWLGVSGLDESTRGPRDGVTLVTAPLEGGGVEILAGLADRQQEPVAACLRARRFNVGRRFQRLTLDRHGHQRFGHS
jgi:hypothetical protein